MPATFTPTCHRSTLTMPSATERAEAATVEQAVETDARVKALTEENGRLSRMLGMVERYRAEAGAPPKWAAPKKKTRAGAAIACVQFSDLHLDEVANPGEMAGLNAYNREIAEGRLKRWADKACEMGDRHPHQWQGAFVWWGGDMVSGAIHDELRETNADVLPGTLVHWAPRIAAAIQQVADHYGHVYVPAVVGNHGRLTIKKSAKRRGRNSWDWLLTQMVMAHCDPEKVTFDIAEGSFLFVPVFDRHIFLTHGDEAGGGNGWAGVWSPLGKIHRQGAELGDHYGHTVAYSVIGHWHQTVTAPHRGIMCNGSMKGYDEYAASLRLRPEPAMQNWWVETPDHGVTLMAPLFLEDRKAEGW